MRCRKVHHLLDDYIRGELASRDMESVARHLTSCAKCDAEAEFLKRYHGNLAAAATHRAPADLLSRVRAGIAAGDAAHDTARSRGIIEWLFFPLKIKLPLEAAGVLATAFVVFIFMRPLLEQPGQFVQREIQDVAPTAPEMQGRSRKAVKYYAAAKSSKQKATLYRSTAEKPAPPVEIDLAVSMQQPSRDEFTAGEDMRSAKEERVAPVSPGARSRSSEPAGSRSSKADAAGGIAPARQATVQLAGEDQIVRIKNMIRPLGGKIISENRISGNRPAYVRVELPEANYARFVDQLNQVGQVTRQPSRRAVQNRRSVDVQVNVVEQK